MMLMWFLSPRSCAFLALLPFVLVKCARFRDGELNPTSTSIKDLSTRPEPTPYTRAPSKDTPH
eukprot:scaffold1420_cov153-Isochrysis_galbana.AAC.3